MEQQICVTRVSTGAPDPLRIFFNAIGRSLEWAPADAATHDADGNEIAGVRPGSPQDVPVAVAQAIVSDAGLAPHFRCEPNPPAVAPEGGPAADAAASEEGASESRSSRRGSANRPR